LQIESDFAIAQQGGEMSGWFVLTDNGYRQYYFVLKAVHGETILSSGIYESKPAALDGINTIQTLCRQEKFYEHRISARGSLYFVLKDNHEQIIGTSQLYSSIFAKEIGLSMVKLNGHTPTIIDIAGDFQNPDSFVVSPA
jgi:uncharacterized protein YegP (UPF0339 family)